MSRARLEHASLFYHIKDGILAKDWSVEVTQEPLDFDTKTNIDGELFTHYRIVPPDQGAYGALPVTNGRGWVYFEPRPLRTCTIFDPTTSTYIPAPKSFQDNAFTIPQQAEESLVVVRNENGDILPREQYDIDYKNGRIRHYDTPPSGVSLPPGKAVTSGTPTTVDYKFHLVSVLDGWPDNESPPELPIVSIYPDTRMDKPMQLGPGVISCRRFIIDVFAKNTGQREDILHSLHTGMYNKRAPVLDLNRTGAPLRHNGTFNSNFLQTFTVEGETVQTYLTLNPGNGHTLYFINLEVVYNITPRESRSELGKFRGRITVTTKTYSDRGIDTVGNLGGNPEPTGGFDSLRLESYSS